jgi:pyridoxal phosphate-dependent aminotransferase EpsN
MPGIIFQLELEETMSNRWLTMIAINPRMTGVSRHNIIEQLAMKH